MEKMKLHTGDPLFESWYGTVTISLLFYLTDTKTVMMFERTYDHSKKRISSLESQRIDDILFSTTDAKNISMDLN
jgi:hypothetical protein